MRSRKVRRAANVAAMSGWTLAFFALVTLMSVIVGDFLSIPLGVVLGVLAYNELRGGAMIRRFEPAGATRLAYNQIALGVVIVVYSVWSLISALRSPDLAAATASVGDPQVSAMLGSITNIVTYGLYGTMVAVGVIVPGLTAIYYQTRARLIRDVLAATPPWVIAALRAAS